MILKDRWPIPPSPIVHQSWGRSAPEFWLVQSLRTAQRFWSHRFSDSALVRKIGLASLAGIATALSGSALALWISDWYEHRALQVIEAIEVRQDALRHINDLSVKIANHPQKLLYALQHYPGQLPAVRRSFNQDIEEAQAAIKAELLVTEQTNLPKLLAARHQDLHPVLARYGTSLEVFSWHILHLTDQAIKANPDDYLETRHRAIDWLFDSSTMGILDRLRTSQVKVETYIQSLQELEETTHNRSEIQSLRIALVLGGAIISLIVGVWVAYQAARTIARPLVELEAVARQVTESGNFSLRANTDASGEIGRLAVALNQLVEWVGNYTNDLNRAQSQAIQAEKMSSLGQLVAGIAHEINNPASFIKGNIGHARDHTATLVQAILRYQQTYTNPPADLREDLEELDLDFMLADTDRLLSSMDNGAERIAKIVTSLRTFARLGESPYKTIDARSAIEAILVLLEHRLNPKQQGQNYRLKCRWEALPPIPCHAGEINQALMHLLTNALDALDSRSLVELAPAQSPRPDDRSAVQSGKSAGTAWQGELHIETQDGGDRAIIQIHDNGSGIDDQHRSKIFDPFFTTKPIGQGTGLGLAIVYQIIVEQHGGSIDLRSTPKVGTTITLSLPYQAARLIADPEPSANQPDLARAT